MPLRSVSAGALGVVGDEGEGDTGAVLSVAMVVGRQNPYVRWYCRVAREREVRWRL
ncbi:hypothetical protein GCM10009747_20510 [Agromyces humatus]|uniref:Uncharacterized protein n=1 Tax=Agromyces humatus TaxID=279573 RepID=A0ABP4WRK9_9MICO